MMTTAYGTKAGSRFFGLMLLFVLAATSVSGATNQSSTAATNQPAGTNAAAKPHADTNAEKPPKLIITPTPKALPNIIRGPYLQCGTTNSMVIRWRTDVPCPSVVRYGLSLTNLNKKTNSSGILSEHVVLISGLQPDTRYYYSLGTADCPIFARLTNNMLFVSTTNGAMAVSTAQRVELANVTNETLVLRVEKKQLLIARPKDGRVVNSSNTVLVVSTTNHSLVVNWTNRTLAATTTNHISDTRPAGPRSSRSSFGTFVVLNTNVTMAGGDTNTSFFTSPRIGRRTPVRIWLLGDPGTRKAEQ